MKLKKGEANMENINNYYRGFIYEFPFILIPP